MAQTRVSHPLLDAYEAAVQKLANASPAIITYDVYLAQEARAREALVAALAAGAEGAPAAEGSYQARVHKWVVSCFGEEVAADGRERNHRFLEESLELVQATGCTASEAHQLVDYVFGRDVGQPGQEVGGVMNTLAALCNAHGLDLEGEAEKELTRVWTISDRIRAKHAAKPKHSPLPGSLSMRPLPGSGDLSATEGVQSMTAVDRTNPGPGWYVVEGETGARTLRHWQRFDTQDACVRFMVRNGWTSDNGHHALFWSDGKWKDDLLEVANS